MGNLLARMILESGDYSRIGSKISRDMSEFAALTMEFLVILEYALGLDSWLGISGSDMETLSKDHRYPSCYQCFPFEAKHDVLF